MEFLRLLKHPWIAIVGTSLVVAWTFVLWRFPMFVLKLDEKLSRTSAVKPSWLLGAEIPVRYLLLLAFFNYRARVLDAWVSKYFAQACAVFNSVDTVREREIHIGMPGYVNGKGETEVTPELLKQKLAIKRWRILIFGEGGVGKTSLACALARGLTQQGASPGPASRPMIPVLIEDDFVYKQNTVPEGIVATVRDKLTEAVGSDDPPSRELVLHLLKYQRVLLVVDGLSELSEDTRAGLNISLADFPANSLIVTSRSAVEAGPIAVKIEPMRVQRDQLSPFMYAYLAKQGKGNQFRDWELRNAVDSLRVVVGDHDITVLLAKLYADQMIIEKANPTGRQLPSNVPDLMLRYVNALNRNPNADELGDRNVQKAAKAIAWNCLRDSLHPKAADFEVVLSAVRSYSKDPASFLAYFERNLRLIQVVGTERDRIRFVLDPLAEYLAALHLRDMCQIDGQSWTQVEAKLTGVKADSPAMGILNAISDCWAAAEIDLPASLSSILGQVPQLEDNGRIAVHSGKAGYPIRIGEEPPPLPSRTSSRLAEEPDFDFGPAPETSERDEGRIVSERAIDASPGNASGMWVRKSDLADTDEPIVLVLVEGTDRRALVLDHYPFTVGRRTDRDVVMTDPRVAREHAQITRETDGIYIVDQNSRGGTFVNGERVSRQRLERNDRIEFGVQGAAFVLFNPDRSVEDVAQEFISQFSSWKPESGTGSDFEMLNVFLEAARKLNSTGVLDDVLQTLLEASLRLTKAERGYVFLRQSDGELRLAAGRANSGEVIYDDSTISKSVLRDAASKATEFVVTDTSDTWKLTGHDTVLAQNLKSIICIPLCNPGNMNKTVTQNQPEETNIQGVLYLDSHFLAGKLSSVSHDILRTIANGAATLIENATLFAAEGAAKTYAQEMAIAADIQQRMTVVTVPDVPYAKVKAVSYPCRDIGGDFFDLVKTEKGMSLIVADISGKGIPAAVLATSLLAILYSQLLQDSSLPEMMESVNRYLCEKVGGQKYATLVVARLSQNGAVEYINCGHVRPIVVSGDKVTRLEDGNLPVGLIPEVNFRSSRLQLNPTDRLIIVTDGVTEAENSAGEFFLESRLEASASGGFAAVERAVTLFRGAAPLSDDLTITEMTYQG